MRGAPLLVLCLAVPCAGLEPNMNGGYEIANGRPSPAAKGTPHANGFSTDWRDYPSPAENPVRSFEVYSPPIRTQYSQVWWTMMRDVPLPEAVVAEFDGKTMAVIGYESDQVQRHADGSETRVPITWAYNHHYGPILAGKGGELKQIRLNGPNDPRDPKTGHPSPDGTAWVVEPRCADVAGVWRDVGSSARITVEQADCNLTALGPWSAHPTGSVDGNVITMSFGANDSQRGAYDPTGDATIKWSNKATWRQGAAHQPGTKPVKLPTSQTFYIGNGGEFRKSYHGMPPGTAQILHSPNLFHIQPMQIDTKNRDGSMETPEQGFAPGPYPASAMAPRTGPDATYSGLLECPCTDRIQKQYTSTYATQHAGSCATPLTASAAECYAAAVAVGITHARNSTGSSNQLPLGCTATLSDQPVSGGGARVSTRTTLVYFNTAASSTVHCGGNRPVRLVGASVSSINVGLSLAMDAATDTATITLTSPGGGGDVWFGVGLGATDMSSLPYAIVVDGAGVVTEHKLGNHEAGARLASSIKVVSSAVKDGVRTVVMTRPVQGQTAQHYSFDTNNTRLDFISAVGSGPAFAYHKLKTASSLALSAVDAPNCICNYPAPFGSTKGSILYTGPVNYTTDPRRATQTLGFNKNCVSEPHADLLHQRNPTCDLHTYQGGLSCCHHLWLLTDTAQENSFKPDIFEYFLKFRFYFQEWTPPLKNGSVPASHQNLVRLYHQTEDAASEYDVPLCNQSVTAKADCVHQITAHWQVRDMLSPANAQPIASQMTSDDGLLTQTEAAAMNATGIKIRFAGGHCHAPSCISLELYNADTGALICRQVPVLGQTLHPTGDGNGTAYDEKGYIALPPCLWGEERYGLEPAPLLTWDTNLTSIKRNNNTIAHLGEMASWQMRGFATH